jgi:ABC-type antimicrobial peptide transport system permease subunit
MSYSFGGPRGYPYLTWGTVAFSYGLVVVLGVVASVYPALTAARLKPVEALNSL